MHEALGSFPGLHIPDSQEVETGQSEIQGHHQLPKQRVQSQPGLCEILLEREEKMM